MEIEILGPQVDEDNRRTLSNINEALAYLRINAAVKHRGTEEEWNKYEVMSFPAVAVEGELKCQGKVPTSREVMVWVTTVLAEREG